MRPPLLDAETLSTRLHRGVDRAQPLAERELLTQPQSVADARRDRVVRRKRPGPPRQRGELPDHARTDHELVAGDLGVGRDFLERGDEQSRIAHGGPLGFAAAAGAAADLQQVDRAAPPLPPQLGRQGATGYTGADDGELSHGRRRGCGRSRRRCRQYRG